MDAPEITVVALLAGAGVFTVVLGVVHVFMPVLFDFEHAIPATGEPLRPFRLLGFGYPTLRSDVRGIAWVMNHAVSLTLVTIGVVDLLAIEWLSHPWAPLIAAWIAAWWLLRAACQLHLGRRRGDRLVMGWFTLLAAVHVAAALVS